MTQPADFTDYDEGMPGPSECCGAEVEEEEDYEEDISDDGRSRFRRIRYLVCTSCGRSV